MPRYIDADLLYRETEKKIKANNEYRMAVVDDEFLDLINDAPTEDVVERSEVAKIFEEIKVVLSRRYHSNKITLGERAFMIIVKHSERRCIAALLADIAELKKKYTEEGG